MTPRLLQGDVKARKIPVAYLRTGLAPLGRRRRLPDVCRVAQGARWLLSEGQKILNYSFAQDNLRCSGSHIFMESGH